MRADFGYSEEDRLGKPYNVKMLRRLYPFGKPYLLLFSAAVALIMLITALDLTIPYITKVAIDRYIVPDTVESETGSARVRYYRINLADPRNKAVVRKYPSLFVVEGGSAHIPYDRLDRLDRNDLSVLRRADLAGVGKAALLLLALVILGFGLNFFQVMIMEYAGQKIMHDLRMHLFAHIQRQSLSFFINNPVGRLVTRATNDIQNMNDLFTSVIVVIFKDIFVLVGIAVVLVSIHWQLALVSFAVLPFVVYASFKFSNLARDVFRTLRIKIAEINTHFSETIGGIRVIQLFLQQRANQHRFDELNHETFLAGMQQVRIFAVFMPVIEILGAIALAVIIYAGGSGVLSGSMSLGAMVAFISYMRMFFRPIRDMAEKYNIMQNALSSAERIFLILDQQTTTVILTTRRAEVPNEIHAVETLSFDGVSFHYLPDEPVLRQISFTLNAGEHMAIVGPTGSGKTTLVSLIFRFYDPSSGVIRLNEVDIRRFDPAVLTRKMALVMQEPFLFSASLYENIVRGHDNMDPERFELILEAANCKTFIDRLPQGIRTVVSEGGKSISSGERQLLSIARAFARNPDLIILDEATSSVDSQTEMKIQDALTRLMTNRTTISIAHRLSTARRAHQILMLNQGRMIEFGNHHELMAQKGFYHKLYRLQNPISA